MAKPRTQEAPAEVIAALDARDLDAFTAAVDALEGSVDSYVHCDRPLVAWVSRQGWGPGTRYLIEKGARPTADALEEAIFFAQPDPPDDVSAVEALLDGGCDPNEPTMGVTPLGWAASINYGGARAGALVRLLVERGADPNREATTPPIHAAVARPAMDALAALLEAGADPNVLDDDVTPLAKLMFEMRGAYERERTQQDGSGSVANEFVPPTLRLLLDHGADASIPTPNGNTPLLLAVGCEDCPDDVIQQLGRAGTTAQETIRCNDKEDVDLLSYALLSGRSFAVQAALIEAGFPLDRPYALLGDRGYLAVVAQHEAELSEYLWEHSPRFRAALTAFRTKKGLSAIVLCAVAGSERLVRALHADGVSVTETFATGQTVRGAIEEYAPTFLGLIDELMNAERGDEA